MIALVVALLVTYALWFAVALIAMLVRIVFAARARDNATILRYAVAFVLGGALVAGVWYSPRGGAVEFAFVVFEAGAAVGTAAACVFLRGKAPGPRMLVLAETLAACAIGNAATRLLIASHEAHTSAMQVAVRLLPLAFRSFADAIPFALIGFFVFRAIAMHRWSADPADERGMAGGALVLLLATNGVWLLWTGAMLSFCCP